MSAVPDVVHKLATTSTRCLLPNQELSLQVDVLRRMQGREEALKLISVYEVQFSRGPAAIQTPEFWDN